jgi:hypothetical protein
MHPQGTRRSDRLSIAIPVEITGRKVTGDIFQENTRTVVVSRHGAAVLIHHRLSPDEQLSIRCPATGKEAQARVVGLVSSEDNDYVYGLAWMDPSVNLWNIYFPPVTEAERVGGRVLMECSSCGRRELAYLNELEMQVLQGNSTLPRHCEQCQQQTIWK